MRIGVLVDPVPAVRGGSFTFQNQILDALCEHGAGSGHDFVVLGHWNNGLAKPETPSHMEYLDIFSNRLLCLRAKIQKFWNVLRYQTRPLPHFKRTYLAEYFARAAGVQLVWYLNPNYGAIDLPFIYTVWDLQHRLQPWFPEVSDKGQWVNRETHYANVLPRASAILTGTEVGKREIEFFYRIPSDHIHVMPFPVPEQGGLHADADDRIVLEKHGLEAGYLFYPAQFWPHKNHSGAVAALAIARNRHGISAPLVLSGSDTSVRRNLEKMVEALGMEKQVRFLGFVPKEECAALYRHAQALLMPTYFGPDNIPPLEAFSHGCPVLASKVSGAEEQLGAAALLFDPRDINDMAEAIRRIYQEESLRDNLIRRGRERARAWNGRQYVEKVFQIIESMKPILRTWSAELMLSGWTEDRQGFGERREASGAESRSASGAEAVI